MIEKGLPPQILNMLTHRRILRHHDVTNLESSKSKFSNFIRIPEARSADLKQTTTAKRLLFARDTS